VIPHLPAFVTLLLDSLTACIFVVGKAGDVSRRGRTRLALEALTATAFIGLGVRLATERR
jgi:threonine/homoserine/homoserine lactone efflux protein